jgi:DNA-binding LacI/PurR family transcriptional regulator
VELSENYGVDSVGTDYSEAAREVMSYLLSLGHRRIGLIYGIGGHELAEDRLQPYRAGLEVAGIPIDENLIVECGPTIEDGYQAAKKLLEFPSRPTAIIAVNDLLSIGAVRAAADSGLSVPRELSLVGYDDIPMANYLVPRLTTVSKDAHASGKQAFELLMKRMQNSDLPRQKIHTPTRLIIRESTGPAPL